MKASLQKKWGTEANPAPMFKDFNQDELLLTCSIECGCFGRCLRIDHKGARGAAHRLISASHSFRGNQHSGVGQRNGAICGDLECQRRSSGRHITVITVDHKTTERLSNRTVPKFPMRPIVNLRLVSYS